MERNTLLIADDIRINRKLLKVIFNEQYEILEAADGEETIKLLEENADKLALLFLDLQMPKKNGLEVLTFMAEAGLKETIPVIMITGESSMESDIQAYDLGVSDIIYKPFDEHVVMRRAMNVIELYKHRISIEEELDKRTRELSESREKLQKSNEFLVNALSSVVEFRSLESGEHIQRVKYFTGMMLRQLQVLFEEYGLTDEQVELIINASALHDLGKIAIPDTILLKPGRLTTDEFEEMKKHTIYGCELLERFKQEDSEFYQYCYDICRYHHERYDGNGYPDKLAGEDIPIWAQVVSIVDVYDALVSRRVYKAPYAFEEAVRMIHEGECGEFSPKIMACFDAVKLELLKATEGRFRCIEEEQGQ